MVDILRIRRRPAGGAAGPPTTSQILNAEIAYNETDDTLYYGKGLGAGSAPTSVVPIAGPGTFAPLASPMFTGNPTSTTSPLVSDSSASLATTAWVKSLGYATAASLPLASTTNPLPDGAVAIGSATTRFALADHVHPTDSTRAPLANPTFTGTVTLPTGTIGVTQAIGDEDTSMATTAFVARGAGGYLPVALNPADTDQTWTSAQMGARVINVTGAITADRTITVPMTGQQKNWLVRNGTTGGFNVSVSNGTAGFTIPPGFTGEFWGSGTSLFPSQNILLGPTVHIGDVSRNALIVTTGLTATATTITTSGTGVLTFGDGIGFGTALAPGGTTDLSRHLALYGTTYGFNVTSGRFNYVTGGSHVFLAGGADKLTISTSGVAIPTGTAITVPDLPTVGTSAANKNYVDAHVAPIIATIAALRTSTTTTLAAATCTVQSYSGTTNKGGGLFIYAASDTTSADNAGTIIVDASSRRWYRTNAQEHRDYNVSWFGALGDGTTDDITAIRAAIAVAKVTTGTVRFDAGVFMVSGVLELPSHVMFIGAGPAVTTIRARTTAAFDIFQSTGFTTLTGTGSVAGPYQFGIFRMSLDGNRALGRTTGRGISIVGYDYQIEDVDCYNHPNAGFYSEWGVASDVPVANGGDGMEARILRMKTFSNGGDGITFNGPHDTYMFQITSFINDGRGIAFGNNLPNTWTANGVQLVNSHSYGNQNVGIQVDCMAYFDTVQGENNRSSGGIAVTSGGFLIATNIICYQNTGYGLSVAGNSCIISNVWLYGNSGDGLDITGVQNTFTNVSSDSNTGYGCVIGAAGTSNNIHGYMANGNSQLGISVNGPDSSVTGLLCIFNTAGGLGVANNLSGVRLEGEVNNNGTGVQCIFNNLSGGNIFDLLIYTIAGQTAWSGTLGIESFLRICTTGASNMDLDVVPKVMQAGSVGEYLTASLPQASAAGAPSGSPVNVVTLSLTAGDWDVSGVVVFTWSTQGAGANAWVSTTSSTQPPSGSLGLTAVGAVLGTLAHINTGVARMSIPSPTTVYLGASSGFGSGGSTVFGSIQARRAR